MIYIPETFVNNEDLASAIGQGRAIKVRLCRDCPYFEQEHPIIDTDGDFGFCTYKTDFAVFDDEPIHWYFTNKNSFCDENLLGDENAY